MPLAYPSLEDRSLVILMMMYGKVLIIAIFGHLTILNTA